MVDSYLKRTLMYIDTRNVHSYSWLVKQKPIKNIRNQENTNGPKPIIRQAILGHVVLNVRDIKRSERFYTEILGMRVAGRNEKTKFCFLSFGREHHDIALAELPARTRYISSQSDSALHHFCVYVRTPKEVDDLVPILKRRRIPIVSGPEHLEISRNRSISFLDPDGNRIEVACNFQKFKK